MDSSWHVMLDDSIRSYDQTQNSMESGHMDESNKSIQ